MDPRKFPSSYHGWLHRNERGREEAVEAAVVDNDAVEKKHFRIGREMDCKLRSLSAYSEEPNLPRWQSRHTSLPGGGAAVEMALGNHGRRIFHLGQPVNVVDAQCHW